MKRSLLCNPKKASFMCKTNLFATQTFCAWIITIFLKLTFQQTHVNLQNFATYKYRIFGRVWDFY